MRRQALNLLLHCPGVKCLCSLAAFYLERRASNGYDIFETAS
jgi:hypothetical protein